MKWTLKIGELSWIPFCSRTVYFPSRSLSRPQSILLKSRAVILVFALCNPLRSSTTSWSMQSKLLPTFTSSTSSSFLVCKHEVWQSIFPCLTGDWKANSYLLGTGRLLLGLLETPSETSPWLKRPRSLSPSSEPVFQSLDILVALHWTHWS